MPIVPNSLKEEKPLHYSAQFRDPITNERMDMKAQWVNEDDEQGEIKAQIKHPHDDTYNLGDRAIAHLGQLREGRDDFSSYGTGVDDEYQRRGYATALYDMLARILHEQGEYRLTNSDGLNEMSRGFWRDAYATGKATDEGWQVRGDL
jgi:ribosomal protein S18 acetylase RimI-like enzyme